MVFPWGANGTRSNPVEGRAAGRIASRWPFKRRISRARRRRPGNRAALVKLLEMVGIPPSAAETLPARVLRACASGGLHRHHGPGPAKPKFLLGRRAETNRRSGVSYGPGTDYSSCCTGAFLCTRGGHRPWRSCWSHPRGPAGGWRRSRTRRRHVTQGRNRWKPAPIERLYTTPRHPYTRAVFAAPNPPGPVGRKGIAVWFVDPRERRRRLGPVGMKEWARLPFPAELRLGPMTGDIGAGTSKPLCSPPPRTRALAECHPSPDCRRHGRPRGRAQPRCSR